MRTLLIIVAAIVLILGGYFIYQRSNKGQATTNNNSNIVQGVKIDILKQGNGPEAKNGDTISVHYTGTFENGTKFDSSLDRGEPFSFVLGVGQVIQGWDVGVLGMKIGEKRKLTIQPEMGYGAQDVGPIPANSTLVFEVEMLEIN